MQQQGSFRRVAFAAHGIGREGGDGSEQRGRSVIYDCLACICYITSRSPPTTLTAFWQIVLCRNLHSGFWATVCKTVRPMLSDRCPVCPVCLSVTLVYGGHTVGSK